MPTKCTLRCSECFEKFTCEGPWPDECPACHVKIPGPEDDSVEIPAFLSLNTRRADAVYRDIERGSEFRAQKAAETLGVPVSEMSHLKVTNLRDATHPGDIAAIPPKPSQEYTQAMRVNHQGNAPVGFLNGGQMAGGVSSQEVQTGPFPNAGLNVLQHLREQHHTHIDPRHRGATQSERPGLETTYPGYRRRA